MPCRGPSAVAWIALGLLLWQPAAALADDETPARSDAFGDPLPAGAVTRLGTVRFRHADYLRTIGFAPDGKTLISAGNDGVRVWEAATGKLVRHFGSGKQLRDVSLSTDARLIAISQYYAISGGLINIWEVSTGKLLHKLGDQDYSMVRFSPDGKRLAALDGVHNPVNQEGTPCQVEIWDTATGKRLGGWDGPRHYISDMQFSPDGKTLLLGGTERTISIHDVLGGKEVRRLRNLPGDVKEFALSPRSDCIAAIELLVTRNGLGSGSWGPGERVFLLDARTGAEVRRWEEKEKKPGTNSFWAVAFAPDGKRLAACSMHGPVRIWDVASGKERRLLPDGCQHSGGLAFAPDGRTLAFGNGGRVVRVLDVETGTERMKATGHQGSVAALAVSRDGRTVFAAVDNGVIHRWDTRTGREVGRLSGHKGKVTGLALSADESSLFSVGFDRSLRRWDLRTGKDRRLLDETNLYGRHLARSPDGKFLAVRVNDKELHLFNTSSGERLHRLTARTQILDAAFTVDGSMVLALTGERKIERWQLPAGRPLPSDSLPPDRDEPPIGNPDSIYGGTKFVLSPDGRLAAHGMDDYFLRLVDLSTQRQVRRSSKLPGNIATIAFAPDSRSLAWAEQSGVIHWLELATWSERRTLAGHAGAVTQLVFTADGKRLVSASEDATVLVWDLMGRESTQMSAEQRNRLWTELADKDAAQAYRAMCRLIAAPDDALACLRPQLKPVPAVEQARFTRLIADLDADAFAVREKATEELRKLDELAEPSLRKALADRPTLEARRRLQALLEDINDHRWHPTPELLRQLRAVEVLERIGTPEARKLLEVLAGGAAGAPLTCEAKAALERLHRQHGGKP